MGKIIEKIEVPDYITHIVLSKARRKKYYTRQDKIPKKYAKYAFSPKGILVGPDGTEIVKNVRTAGTPRLKKINGQDLYKGMLHHHTRSKLIHTMKDYFRDKLSAIKPVKNFPIEVAMEMYTYRTELSDIDNASWVYFKVILDVLQDLQVIPEDSVDYVKAAGRCEFKEIKPPAKRKLVIYLKQL